MTNNISITKDLARKQIHVIREFNAPLEKVWRAFTESNILDKWWAPRPWKAETKSMEFKPGGQWLYCMVGPDGTKHWCIVKFKTITPQQSFSADNSFCDEHGNLNPGSPVMHWLIEFNATPTGTKVDTIITFDKDADLKMIVEMGFEGGYTMGLNNLEELLEG